MININKPINQKKIYIFYEILNVKSIKISDHNHLHKNCFRGKMYFLGPAWKISTGSWFCKIIILVSSEEMSCYFSCSKPRSDKLQINLKVFSFAFLIWLFDIDQIILAKKHVFSSSFPRRLKCLSFYNVNSFHIIGTLLDFL